jgi:SAM-dependent methyltransferase
MVVSEYEEKASIVTDRKQHLDTIRSAWDAYHADYMAFHLKERPDFYEHFAKGGTTGLDDYVISALGDVSGLSLLDTCCACDAAQAFSWTNLGAKVTACDLSPEAIRIARDNARKLGLAVDFHVADAQTLEPIPDAAFDIVFATYLVWFEDLSLACRNWHRVLRPGGRLLMHFHHPVTLDLAAEGVHIVPQRNYFDGRPVTDDFTGTDMADRHGGWGKSVPSVEFHHTLSAVANAGLSAGLQLLRMSEHSHNETPPLSNLPSQVLLLWRKTDGSQD